eukprot:CAMPEP_0185300498 /NCGR_PEP_ID=MMETSP1363-20130426/12068_1 /TAXON_ID=38817 /ORGANISM="Gephyrocapsa oceanica, Strain RCC1303" /LENGTH=97 /DNA_ID=CAMNT_0027897465 /DNA_START=112 /DNA_END=406 /DNA_ORIENTATION=-
MRAARGRGYVEAAGAPGEGRGEEHLGDDGGGSPLARSDVVLGLAELPCGRQIRLVVLSARGGESTENRDAAPLEALERSVEAELWQRILAGCRGVWH